MEERIVDPKTGGVKGRKAERYDLIPPDFLASAIIAGNKTDGAAGPHVTEALHCLANFLRGRRVLSLSNAYALLCEAMSAEGVHPGDELARVYGMGAGKYEPWNWMRGYAWSLSFASACRHVSLWARGQQRDEESGLHHLAHAAWHCVTLGSFVTHGLGTDDLYPRATAPVKRAYCEACGIYDGEYFAGRVCPCGTIMVSA